jgi:serine protease Do
MRAMSKASPALFAAAVVVGMLPATVVAQENDVATTAPVFANTATPATTAVLSSQRDAEYAALARDVETFDREFSLVKRVVKLVTPAVVHIESKPLPKFTGLLRVEEAGSGVIVQYGAKFYVITNRHVIRHSTPERIDIHVSDGRVIHPAKVWGDAATDVAVMSLEVPNLVPARIGNSDALEIGDFVLAIGSPFGLSQSVTRGIVSAKGRHNLDLGDQELLWQNFIQTDAAINPGNSGGPLVNLRGEIVGMVESRPVPRGIIGVDLDDQFTERRARDLGLAQLVGTRVIGVRPDSPAFAADIRVDDVIVQFNGVTIANDEHLRGLVKLSEVGKSADILIYRGGKPIRAKIQIANSAEFAKE